ncbi:MAG: heparinase II/III family protein [Pseudomonadota bacterium]
MAQSDGINKSDRFAARDVVQRVQRAWGESPFYQSQLRGPAPDRIFAEPADPYTPDKKFARSFADGRMSLGDEQLECEGELARAWDQASLGGNLRKYLQQFIWMRHLHSLGDDGAKPARALMRSWLDRYERWSPDAWEPYATSERLFFLCAYGTLVLSGGDAMWRSRVLNSMARQTRHLAKSAHRAETEYQRLMAAMALAIVGHCLPGCEPCGVRGVEMVRRELRLQILPDGGHVSRNPSRQLAIAVRLSTLLSTLKMRRIAVPGYLEHVAGRISAICQLFRCGDGRLAVFNGGAEDDGKALVSLQGAPTDRTEPAILARHAGYQRMGASRDVVLIDVAAKSSQHNDVFQSAGSLHYSVGRTRIFTNCGGGDFLGADWSTALRSAAAHCGLSFDGAGLARPIITKITHRRGEDSHGQLVEFEGLFGGECDLTYMRRLYLAAGGGDLRGLERLSRGTNVLRESARIRFHIHPKLRASLARDERSILLAGQNREGWRFRATGCTIQIEKSVYCGKGDGPVASEQIVLIPNPEAVDESGAISVKWAVKRAV